MKNYVQPGETITVVATAPMTAGLGYLFGAMFGIATTSGQIGDQVELQTEGVFDVNKVSAQAWTVGARIYWDNAAGNFTTTVGSNTLVGVAVLAAQNPSSTGRVRLNASF